MTVPAVGFSGPTYVQLPANGSATTFSYPFLITATTDLIVGFIIAGVYTQQSGGYQVNGLGNPGGGQVVFTTAPASGLVDLRSLIPETQPTNFANLGAYLPENTTNAVDRVTRNIADLYRLTYQFGIHGPDQEATGWPALPNAQARANTGLVFDANGLPSLGAIPTSAFTQALFNAFLISAPLQSIPQTPAEAATSAAIVNGFYSPLNMLRYGLVPNSLAAAGNNTAIAQALFNPLITAGPTGTFVFPNNSSGTPDTYFFNGIIPLRDGVRLNLQECILNFTKAYTPSDNTMGFFTFIRDVSIENGTIQVNYTGGSAGINPGTAIRFGSRSGYPFGAYPNGIFDQDDLVANNLPLMGNITLRNLNFVSNNPTAAAPGIIMAFGGLRNVVIENIHFDGQGVAPSGLYYEFGFASTNGSPAQVNWTSSHACNMRISNIHAQHLDTSAAQGAGVSLVGAHHCLVENLTTDHAVSAFLYLPGEALNFRPWAPTDIEGAKWGITLRNITGSNIVGTGILLGGSGAATGYLAGAGLTLSQQVDLMTFSLDGFAVSANGVGISVSGNCDIRNGRADGPSGSGQIQISDDCVSFSINNCDILNSNGSGIRCGFNGIWPSPRQKIGTISNCRISGNVGGGIVVSNSRSVIVTASRLGYNTLYDAVNESVQGNCIVVSGSSNGDGVIADSCFCTPAGGVAYNASGNTGGNNVRDPKGTVTFVGTWNLNGVVQASSTTIGTAASVVNTFDKFSGKLAQDTSNKRLMVAQGPNPTDPWYLNDGTGVFVTPA